jgi:hypothetical protein
LSSTATAKTALPIQPYYRYQHHTRALRQHPSPRPTTSTTTTTTSATIDDTSTSVPDHYYQSTATADTRVCAHIRVYGNEHVCCRRPRVWVRVLWPRVVYNRSMIQDGYNPTVCMCIIRARAHTYTHNRTEQHTTSTGKTELAERRAANTACVSGTRPRDATTSETETEKPPNRDAVRDVLACRNTQKSHPRSKDPCPVDPPDILYSPRALYRTDLGGIRGLVALSTESRLPSTRVEKSLLAATVASLSARCMIQTKHFHPRDVASAKLRLPTVYTVSSLSFGASRVWRCFSSVEASA